MAARDLAAIRDATNKSWVLGDNRFKAHIEVRTGRQARPLEREGDRKSGNYPKLKNQCL